jgi:hypothetical protein
LVDPELETIKGGKQDFGTIAYVSVVLKMEFLGPRLKLLGLHVLGLVFAKIRNKNEGQRKGIYYMAQDLPWEETILRGGSFRPLL